MQLRLSYRAKVLVAKVVELISRVVLFWYILCINYFATFLLAKTADNFQYMYWQKTTPKGFKLFLDLKFASYLLSKIYSNKMNDFRL